MEKRPRCKSGIDQLDAEIEGGIPIGSTILISGSSGVGKTTTCMQFLANGVKFGDNGVFFTSAESIVKLKKHLKGYDFFNESLMKSGKLSIIDLWTISDRLGLDPDQYSAEDANILFEVIRDITKELNAKRVVIDSVTSLCYRLQTPEMIRDFIFKLGSSVATLGCTSIITSEVPPHVFRYSQYDIAEFIADGIVFLSDIDRQGDLIRTLQIIKMRGTSHSRTKFAMNLSSKNGVSLAPLLRSRV